MNKYELNAGEIGLVLTALRFTAEHGYTYEAENKGDLTEYYDMIALLARLDPKPVKKEGWMVVWDGDNQYCKTSVTEDRQEVSRLLGAMGGYPNARIVRVTWED